MCQINTKCPYCGSSDICADIDIRITGTLMEDGSIYAKDYWGGQALNEAIGESSQADIHGFCSSCGYECDFEWEKGFVK